MQNQVMDIAFLGSGCRHIFDYVVGAFLTNGAHIWPNGRHIYDPGGFKRTNVHIGVSALCLIEVGA